MGPKKNHSKLLEYERRLEKFFHKHPELGGICQYHADTLPREMIRQGFRVHPAIFVSQTLSLLNPHYIHPDSFAPATVQNTELDAAITHLCQLES
jgi:MEDS: MEthanogen/methylotroph, DcmR Sensory domain